jgi:hypothetical protein
VNCPKLYIFGSISNLLKANASKSMNWSSEEKENLTKLLLSVDKNNRALGIEILNQSENPEEFTDLFYFLISCNFEIGEEPNFQTVLDKIQDERKALPLRVFDFFCPLRSSKKEEINEFIDLFEAQYTSVFERYFAIAPHYAYLYNSLGNYLIYNKMKQKGLEYLKKAAHFAPDSYSHNFDYAFNLNESKKNALTIIKHYEKCIELDDFGIGPYHNIGRIYSHHLKDYAKALEIMKVGNDKYPCADTMIEMALAEENLGNIDLARNYLEMAINTFPDSDLAYNNFAFLLWKFYDEPEYAKSNIDKALQIKPNDGLYWHTLAEVEWYAFKNREKALEALYKAKKVQKSYKGGDEMIAELEKG